MILGWVITWAPHSSHWNVRDFTLDLASARAADRRVSFAASLQSEEQYFARPFTRNKAEQIRQLISLGGEGGLRLLACHSRAALRCRASLHVSLQYPTVLPCSPIHSLSHCLHIRQFSAQAFPDALDVRLAHVFEQNRPLLGPGDFTPRNGPLHPSHCFSMSRLPTSLFYLSTECSTCGVVLMT